MNTKSQDLALLILRITFGGLMALNHGLPKLMKAINDNPIKFADPIGVGMEFSLYLAVFAEFVCAILLVIGLFTRFSLVPLIFTMAVAAFIIHGGDGIKEMESALIYLMAYISLMLTGPGEHSVDAKIGRPW